MAATSPTAQTDPTRRGTLTASYALAAFAAGLLVFAIQPMIAKFVLPRFGGGSDVWTACMLFFQAMLLCGYAYGHLAASRLGRRTQAVVHIAVLAAAVAALPIRPSAVGPNGLPPVAAVLAMLTVSVGLPYFALASSSPLLQSWFAHTSSTGQPYRLYAWSNAGSLLAVVGYPFVLEPWLSRHAQAAAWSWAAGGLAALVACLALVLLARPKAVAAQDADTPRPDPAAPEPHRGDLWLWIVLPASASVVLLAATNKITQDVAAIPLLWMAPLCLYLLSFVVCFHDRRWYVRPLWMVILLVCLVAAVYADRQRRDLSILAQIGIYLATVGACCMVCHGELYRLRPSRHRLTRYYLCIALGGCVGGVLVAVVVPLIFRTYTELYLGLAACCISVLLADRTCSPRARRRRWAYAGVIVFACVLVAVVGPQRGANERALAARRNFYGLVTVWDQDTDSPVRRKHVLTHGVTIHGLQFTADDRRALPTAYYGRDSGVGLAIAQLAPSRPWRIGVIGLGVGTVATYGRPGDAICFYEINPAVADVARAYFTYLADTAARVEVVMGDARLSLERQADQDFDLLALDAFSGDSVPLHLLTAEAVELYLRHLAPEGVLAVHCSGLYLDLQPVVTKLAQHAGLAAVCIIDGGDADKGTLGSTWVLLARDGKVFDAAPIRRAAGPAPADLDRIALWTDDYTNPLQLLR